PPACRARRSRAPALRGNRGSGRCPRRSACRCAFFAPWKSARGFLPLFHLVFRSVPLPFSRVLRYNLSWTKYSLLRLWILALPFYLIGLALSAFLFLTPTFIIEPKFLDDRGVDALALCRMVAGALELVRHFVAGGDAEKVRRVHVRAVGEADGKRLGL